MLNAVNPEACLKDILSRIAVGHTTYRIAELMPWRTSFSTPAQSPSITITTRAIFQREPPTIKTDDIRLLELQNEAPRARG